LDEASLKKSDKQEGQLILVKVKATFSNVLKDSPVNFERLYRGDPYLQDKIFRPAGIEWQ
jgi:hypothetical protein